MQEDIFLLEEVVDVFLEVGGDLVQGGEGRRAFVGLEERNKFGGEAERAGEGGLGKAQIGAGFSDGGAEDPLHA